MFDDSRSRAPKPHQLLKTSRAQVLGVGYGLDHAGNKIAVLNFDVTGPLGLTRSAAMALAHQILETVRTGDRQLAANLEDN